MNRRALLAVLVCAASGFTPMLSLSARAAAKVWRIGILHPRTRLAPGKRDNYTDFVEGMRALGYVEGRNLTLHWQFAENALDRLPALAAALVHERVNVIVTTGTPAVGAAQQATRTIPIVALQVGDPVANGFAASLARPGGNVTGLTALGIEIDTKRLALLMAIVPGAPRIAYLINPDNPSHVQDLPRLESAVRKAGKELVPVNARAVDDLPAAFELATRRRAAALLVAADSVFSDHMARIGSLAQQHGLPAITAIPAAAEHVLAAFRGGYAEGLARRSAMLVDKIFKGAKAGDLPFEQPTNFTLVINLKIAKALGIDVPQSVLLQASRVIE